MRPDKLSSYISIDTDGTVIAYYGKIDGGQGLETAIAQMVAEEIDVPWERVRVVMGDTGLTVDMGGATAGNGLRQGGLIMRQTAAEARRLLIEMAGKKLEIAPADLTVTDGVVHAVDRPRQARLLCGAHRRPQLDAPIAWRGLAQQLAVKVDAPLKKPSEFKVIGKPMPRRDMAGKGVRDACNSAATFGCPNMLHARMIRPTVAGAVPVTVDEKSIADIPGAQVVWIKDFLAVVAEKEWNAVKAAQALKVTWSESKPNFPGHGSCSITCAQGTRGQAILRSRERRGAPPSAWSDRCRRASSRPCTSSRASTNTRRQSHASMGPACAVADVREGQRDGVDQHAEAARLRRRHRRAAGAAAGEGAGDLDVRHRRLRPRRPGRRDGRRGAALPASRPPRAGAVYAPRRRWPGTPRARRAINRSRVGLDASGKVVAYENISKAFSMEDCNTREQHPADTLAGMALGAPLNWRPAFGIPGNGYKFENAHWGWEVIAPLMDRSSPLRSTHIRDPFGLPLLFGSESFIDEVAAATKY